MTRSEHRYRVVVARAIATCAAILLSLPLLLAPSSVRADEARRRILILHPYNYTFPATALIADGARDRLLERSPQGIDIDAEFLDLVDAAGPGHESLVATYLSEKYARKRPDVVLAVGNEALAFLLRHPTAIVPGTPVVFVGVSNASYSSLRPPPEMTGVTFDATAFLTNTLALAEQLQPDARRLFLITGSAAVDRRWQAVARSVIQNRKRKIETTYLFDLTHDALFAEISRIPANSIVVFLSLTADSVGRPFVQTEDVAAIINRSSAPVYSPYLRTLGDGLVGGFGEPWESIGRAGADMVLEILGGKDPSTLPLRTNPALAYYVDYKAMQRWGLRESDLPAGTIVRFKPPGIWQEHRDLVLAALAVFALQTAFAGALLVQRHRRRRAELLLKESEERMTFTAASVNIGLWQFNPETHELWATEHCRTLFGLARDVPLTRDNFLKAVHPEDRERAISSLRTAATQDRPAVHDVRVVQPDGGIRWVRVRARGHPDSRGAPRQLSGIFVDMTAQKAAEAEASLRRQEVTHLMRVSALGELSGAIAHEVNQPLTAIQSNAETGLDLLSADRPDLAELGDVLRDIASDNQRASAVIQRLRNLLQKNEGSFEPVDLNQLARSTCALLNSELIGRKIDVKFDLTGALPETFGDPVQLQQVLLNLVMNAMDAMTSTPAAQRLVTISTRATGLGTIELQVIDRGIGISLPDESRLFQAFHTTKAHGLGLGLSICSTIIQAHGGHLTLVNGEAGGAVATFSLPAHVMAVAAK